MSLPQNRYKADLRELEFVLFEQFQLGNLLGREPYQDWGKEEVQLTLAEVHRFATEVTGPLNAVGDREGCRVEGGQVITPTGFKEAWQKVYETGFKSLIVPPEFGGQSAPRVLSAIATELTSGSNTAFDMYPGLTIGAADLIEAFGTPEQRERYCHKMFSGEWAGTMCLTEPQAGSDVGALRTRAVPEGDRYRIFGTKVFITYGEHDLAENIVHLVLARIEGAPSGSKGLSLFIVPKFLPQHDGTPGRRNDLRCVSLEHKLGVRASPTCVMAYGDDEGAIGWLIGAPGDGMRCMFTVMNNARLAVGHQGLGVAERAFQQALTYARERVQGGRDGKPVPIIEHLDVRRMLLTMRAQIAAMRALAYWTAAWMDRSERHPEPAERQPAADRVALLTPMVKAWCTDLAVEIASMGIQVHGGMGFIEETGAAQHLRDARILPIYEGTNGIQALDLVSRKLQLDGGELPWSLLNELRAEVAGVPDELAPPLHAALVTVERTTGWLQAAGPDDRAAGAAAYLRLFATTVGGVLLARGALAAEGSAGADWPALARFYLTALLPPALALETPATAGAAMLDAALPAG